MKTAKWLVIGMAAAVVVGGLTVAAAKGAGARQLGAGQGALGQRFLARIGDRLNLSDDQKAKIKAELASEKDTLSKLVSTLHEARVNLRETIQKSGASENEIRGASAKVAAAEADLAVERAKLYGRISPILTAQQLARVNELQQRVDELVDNAIATFGQRLAE
jgi:Spy/CpxP family protein refolding chaperone